MATDPKELEFQALRAEILQSISMQHRILLAGYGALATFGGFLVAGSYDWPVPAVLPMLAIATTALWTVECNRMVRASYYLAIHVWPALGPASQAAASVEGWERWIRSEDSAATEFRSIQDRMQLVVVGWIPVGATVAGMLTALYRSEWLTCGPWVISIAYGLIWLLVLPRTGLVSDLRRIWVRGPDVRLGEPPPGLAAPDNRDPLSPGEQTTDERTCRHADESGARCAVRPRGGAAYCHEHRRMHGQA